MIIKSKIIRDTVLLTLMQLFLDTGALMLNVFITGRLGASAIGILSLIGSFLGLAGILSNGNAFLCTSRLVSEEIGRKNGCPNGVLKHGIKLCLILSSVVSVIVVMLAEPISIRFFSGAHMTSALRLMPFALITGALSSCLKGYFNACRRAAVTAVGDIAEFITRCLVIICMTMLSGVSSEEGVCRIMILSIIAANSMSLTILAAAFIKFRERSRGKCSLSFRQYAAYSFPIMGGSVITAVLSSTNDALIPICLRQYGDSAGEALSKFGIFEAIVIPTIFFPSVILCSMSGIIVSEAARAKAANNKERIKSFTERIKMWTLMFSIFASAVLIRFGREIGELLGGGELAGRMIAIIAPVVPFIYMEIVLEALIKGLGLQSFSSVNYLAEYIIRIAAVLILIPRIGFYGIVVSYYASNIFGNCCRFIKITKATGAHRALCGTIILPVGIAAAAGFICKFILNFADIAKFNAFTLAAYIFLWGSIYFAIFCSLGKVRLFDKTAAEVFVDTAQHMD
ncbi:polysaccharide biosynthesis C-terminal domain-containing protein [Ruminococcus flavefaciens]|uniref:polysaccharide biosynthesis C-terminal domain-containing protein n=1 Tax=Ruminococcus flavefaciens TaxID=1265 RepID=UPI0026EAE9D2|nr:polysaccharide biosynthesis C-terminal domain-containing protein [Ruminococcus flavefaciens]MDD7517705.1 oligosaccharide flippase family protein [Ruminococcus flavefaciens]MDY5690506.1 oligosaccharide flippase family protein [Ruminococcus flavefaciens]